MRRPALTIVTPANRAANNGNWQTASRWARLLAANFDVRVSDGWNGQPADALIALHARRSASSIQSWADIARGRPLVVVLTGTDLYRDIQSDPSARQSMRLAHRLVVLQEMGLEELPAEFRAKTVVIHQSASARIAVKKTCHHLRVVAVGHLREEKSPQTVFAVARRMSFDDGIYLDHIGAGLDRALADSARRTMRQCPHYRWLGALTHNDARRRIQHAHLLIHPSRIEGGAHVIMEAIRSGTPVLASRISGNIGMLGANYSGYFDQNDLDAIANLLREARSTLKEPHGLIARLTRQCIRRACLFAPERERAALDRLLAGLLRK